MKTHHYDVVHIHNSSVFCILEAIAAKAAGIPKVIVHSHNTVMGGTAGIKFVKNIIQIIGKSFWRFLLMNIVHVLQRREFGCLVKKR